MWNLVVLQVSIGYFKVITMNNYVRLKSRIPYFLYLKIKEVTEFKISVRHCMHTSGGNELK